MRSSASSWETRRETKRELLGGGQAYARQFCGGKKCWLGSYLHEVCQEWYAAHLTRFSQSLDRDNKLLSLHGKDNRHAGGQNLSNRAFDFSPIENAITLAAKRRGF